MNKLIYLDSNSLGNVHEGYNSSSLLMFSYLFDKVEYRSCKSSKESVFAIIGDVPSNIHYKPIKVVKMDTRIKSFCHHIYTAFTNIKYVVKAKDSVLLINANNLWELPIINFLLKIIQRRVVVVCHGELEFLVSGNSINRISRKILTWMKNPKTKISKGLYFSVLGTSILKNVEKELPLHVSSHFFSFNLTFISSKFEKETSHNEKIKIGVVGTTHANKGLREILLFGEELKQYQNYEFYTLGRVLCNPDVLKEKGVRYIVGSDKGFVSRDTLISYIKGMDVIVFLHSMDSYKFTASSSLMDAIDFEKPILSLHNDYFDYIHEKVNYGELFSNTSDMIMYLQNKNGINLKINYKKNKEILSPYFERIECCDSLKRIGFLL